MKLLLVFLLFPQLSFGMSLAMTQVVASRQVIYEEAIRALGPVAYWRLGEQSGTNANDDTAGLHDGTYTNTPTLNAVPLLIHNGRSSVAFAGASDEYVTIPDHNDLDFTTDFTIMAWFSVDTDTSVEQQIIAKAWPGYLLRLNVTTGYLQFLTHDGALNLLGGSVDQTDGATYFSVGTVTASTGNLYSNGSLVAGPLGSFECNTNTLTLQIARREATALPLTGQLDEVAVFSYGLSASKIQMLYRSGAGLGVSPGDSW